MGLTVNRDRVWLSSARPIATYCYFKLQYDFLETTSYFPLYDCTTVGVRSASLSRPSIRPPTSDHLGKILRMLTILIDLYLISRL